MFSYNQRNKRIDPRMYTRIPVVYEISKPGEKGSRKKSGVIKNISKEGMGIEIDLEVDEAISLLTELDVKFQLPHDIDFFNAKIKVMWVRAALNKRMFYVGALFTSLRDDERERIVALIERLNIHKLSLIHI